MARGFGSRLLLLLGSGFWGQGARGTIRMNCTIARPSLCLPLRGVFLRGFGADLALFGGLSGIGESIATNNRQNKRREYIKPPFIKALFSRLFAFGFRPLFFVPGFRPDGL